jgi:hypothetical protein
VEVLAAHSSLRGRDAELPGKRLEHSGLSGAIAANERSDVSLQPDISSCRIETAEILDGNLLDLHSLKSELTDILAALVAVPEVPGMSAATLPQSMNCSTEAAS